MTIRVAILTSSDLGAQGKRQDTSGPAIREILTTNLDAAIVDYVILPDDREILQQTMMRWADSGRVDLIMTTGGTGFTPRDVTPEATLAVIDRRAPGLEEAMRADSIRRTPHGMLSRGVCGLRGRCLIINLPGSEKAVRENLAVILPALPHAIQLLQGTSQDRDHQFATKKSED